MPKPETLDQPRNSDRPENHGTPVCLECKINAAWRKSKRQWCWWCEGEPSIGNSVKKPSQKLRPATPLVKPKKGGMSC